MYRPLKTIKNFLRRKTKTSEDLTQTVQELFQEKNIECKIELVKAPKERMPLSLEVVTDTIYMDFHFDGDQSLYASHQIMDPKERIEDMYWSVYQSQPYKILGMWPTPLLLDMLTKLGRRRQNEKCIRHEGFRQKYV